MPRQTTATTTTTTKTTKGDKQEQRAVQISLPFCPVASCIVRNMMDIVIVYIKQYIYISTAIAKTLVVAAVVVHSVIVFNTNQHHNCYVDL